nr:ATP-binding cassette domain-containing protein [Sphingomonas sanguinis]
MAIETEHLTKRYAGRSVVDDVALRVPMGCVYGFLGPNGAGKTTTMRLLLGLLRADAGTIRLVGHDLVRRRRDALAQVGAFVESASLYDHLTGRANLDITRRLLGLPAGEIDRVLEIVEMRDAAPARTGTYSLGMKQRLALARAMLGSPRLLLLDEPTNGLDPDGIVAMRLLIRALPARIGGTVFVSSHLLTEVEQMGSPASPSHRPMAAVSGKDDRRACRIRDDDDAGTAVHMGGGVDWRSDQRPCPARDIALGETGAHGFAAVGRHHDADRDSALGGTALCQLRHAVGRRHWRYAGGDGGRNDPD